MFEIYVNGSTNALAQFVLSFSDFFHMWEDFVIQYSDLVRGWSNLGGSSLEPVSRNSTIFQFSATATKWPGETSLSVLRTGPLRRLCSMNILSYCKEEWGFAETSVCLKNGSQPAGRYQRTRLSPRFRKFLELLGKHIQLTQIQG